MVKIPERALPEGQVWALQIAPGNKVKVVAVRSEAVMTVDTAVAALRRWETVRIRPADADALARQIWTRRN